MVQNGKRKLPGDCSSFEFHFTHLFIKWEESQVKCAMIFSIKSSQIHQAVLITLKIIFRLNQLLIDVSINSFKVSKESRVNKLLSLRKIGIYLYLKDSNTHNSSALELHTSKTSKARGL